MKTKDLVSRVLFWLGLLTDIGSIVALEVLNYGRSVVWVKEFDLMTVAVVIGLALMATSITLDLVRFVKTKGGKNEDEDTDRM